MIWPFSELRDLRAALAMANESTAQAVKNTNDLSKMVTQYESMFAVQGDMVDRLGNDLETERMRLVACGVGAMSNTRESASKQRVAADSPYFCASVKDVYDAVDREMALREQNKTYEEALRKLSCLGNGERPGNSDGNMIAIRALEAHASTKVCIKCGSDMIPLHSEDKKLCSNGACGHEVPWTLEEGQHYQYKRNVEPFVEDRSNQREELEPPRASLERL